VTIIDHDEDDEDNQRERQICGQGHEQGHGHGEGEDEVGNFPLPPRWGPRFRMRPQLPGSWLALPNCVGSPHHTEAVDGSYSNTGSSDSSEEDTDTDSTCPESIPDAESSSRADHAIGDATASVAVAALGVVGADDPQTPNTSTSLQTRHAHSHARTDSAATIATVINTNLNTPSTISSNTDSARARIETIAIAEIPLTPDHVLPIQVGDRTINLRHNSIFDIPTDPGPNSHSSNPPTLQIFGCLECVLAHNDDNGRSNR
jgi:hypothetical protein